MSEPLETIDHRGGRIEVYPDDHGGTSRDWDNLATFLCWHPRYNLGDIQIRRDDIPRIGPPLCWYCGEPIVAHGPAWEHVEPNDHGCADTADGIVPDDDSYPSIEAWLMDAYGAIEGTVMPLYLIDHSGLSMSTGPFACDPGGWDSGIVGFAFVTPEGVERCGTTPDLFRECIEGEVATYDADLTGAVCGYIAYAPDGTEVGSCWGFYPEYGEGREPYAYMLSEARAEIDAWCDDLNARTDGRTYMVAAS